MSLVRHDLLIVALGVLALLVLTLIVRIEAPKEELDGDPDLD